ncbi:MAG: TonB-dependent receptor [Thermodesulfobacteriota bacterium]
MRRKLWLIIVLALLGSSGWGITAFPAQEDTGKASEKKEKAETLPEIVVTATKTPRNPDDIPASITVITKEDIARQNIQTADDALRQVPGTFVKRGKGIMDTMMAVSLRGFPADTQKRTLVLFDGQDMSSGYTNTVRWSSLAVEDIERIEVIRGPFSALYGGNAMGGVINIITKTTKKLELGANFEYATYDTYNYYLSAGNRFWDRLSLKASYKSRETAGYPANLVTRTASHWTVRPRVFVSGWEQTLTSTGTPTYIIGDSGDSSWRDHIFEGKLSWDIADGQKINAVVLLNWNKYWYGPFHTYLTDGVHPVVRGTVGLIPLGQDPTRRFSSLQEGAFLNGFGWEHIAIYALDTEHRLTDSTTLKLKTGLVNNPLNAYTTPSSSNAATSKKGGPGTYTSTPSKNWNMEVQIDQTIGSMQVLTGGLVYKGGWAKAKDYNLYNWRDQNSKTRETRASGGRDRNFALYLQDEITWHPMVTTVIGGRLDWWSTYGGSFMDLSTTRIVPLTNLPGRKDSAFSPKVALLFKPWEWMSWRASCGTAFRPPNVYELYRTWRSSMGTLYRGNPDLVPETTKAWEVGCTLKPFKGTVLSTTFYQNFVKDLIYRVQDPTDPTGRTQDYRNAAKARIAGWELEVTQKVCRWLDIFGNLTLVDARIRENPFDRNSVGKKITYTPRQQYNFGANANYWILNVNLTGRYVSKVHSRADNGDVVNNVPGSYDPFFTLDTKVTVTPLPWCNISLAINNLMDRQYFYGTSLTPGRTWWLQAGVKY